MSSDWGRKIVKIRPDVTSSTGPSLDASAKLDHSKKMNDETSYRHEMHLRDEQLRREIDLRGESFRAEQVIRDKALDDRLGRMEDSVSSATKEIKDFKLWMAGIGVAVVLAIMGANYTLIGSAQGIFDGGKAALQSQQRIEKLIEESQAQAKENREILEALKTQVPPPISPQK